jgi:hypothetical protein
LLEEELSTERSEANVLRWQLQNKSAKMTDLETKLSQSIEREKGASLMKIASVMGNGITSPGAKTVSIRNLYYY